MAFRVIASIAVLSSNLLVTAVVHAADSPRITAHKSARASFIDHLEAPVIKAGLKMPAQETNAQLTVHRTSTGGHRSELVSMEREDIYQHDRSTKSVFTTPAAGVDGASLQIRSQNYYGPKQSTVTTSSTGETLRVSSREGLTGYDSRRVTATRFSGTPAQMGALVAKTPQLLELPAALLKGVLTGSAFLVRDASRDSFKVRPAVTTVQHAIQADDQEARVSPALYSTLKRALQP